MTILSIDVALKFLHPQVISVWVYGCFKAFDLMNSVSKIRFYSYDSIHQILSFHFHRLNHLLWEPSSELWADPFRLLLVFMLLFTCPCCCWLDIDCCDWDCSWVCEADDIKFELGVELAWSLAEFELPEDELSFAEALELPDWWDWISFESTNWFPLIRLGELTICATVCWRCCGPDWELNEP